MGPRLPCLGRGEKRRASRCRGILSQPKLCSSVDPGRFRCASTAKSPSLTWPQKSPRNANGFKGLIWLRGQDLNLRPSGYEPDELPGCSTPRQRLRAVGSITTALIKRKFSVLGRPGDDLLSHVLRQSTIGAKAFDGRVRDGIGSYHLAKATRPAKNGRSKTGFFRYASERAAL